MEYNVALTAGFKELLRRVQLEDTGDLLNSVQVFVAVDSKLNVKIDVRSLDYLKYHIEKKKLPEKFAALPIFEAVVSKLLEQPLLVASQKFIETGATLPTPSIDLYFNGI